MYLTIPNLFTALRIFMTPVILGALAGGHYRWGGWIFGLAAFTDMLDGTVARRFGGVTKFGAYLDPVADKFLLSGIYIGLAAGHAVPLWCVLIIFGRDLWILTISAVAFRFTAFRNFQPSAWGKASTFLQIMTAIGVMAAKGYQDQVLDGICRVLILAIAVLAVISASEYTWRGIAWFLSRRRATMVRGNSGVVDLKASRE